MSDGMTPRTFSEKKMPLLRRANTGLTNFKTQINETPNSKKSSGTFDFSCVLGIYSNIDTKNSFSVDSGTMKSQLAAFKRYTYETHCNKGADGSSSCYVSENDTKKNKNKNPKYNNGIEGNQLQSTGEDYISSIKNIILLFLRHNLLLKIGNEYYIDSEKKLSWNNIKTVSDNGKLYWLFRKAIIDCIIKSILQGFSPEERKAIIINSVGSSNLTSDYDLTVYSQAHGYIIISKFNKLFKKIFKNPSSEVFDTNIYGKGFITFVSNKNTTKHMCSKNNPVYIYNTSETIRSSQLMWAFVKYFKDLVHKFGYKHAKNMFMNSIVDKANCAQHMTHALRVYDYLSNRSITYDEILKTQDNPVWNEYLTDKRDTLLLDTDFISILNFYGTETYMSRGAFIDTVVNAQMCPNNKVKLSVQGYFMSVLENAGYFLHHNEHTKYLLRVASGVAEIFNIMDNDPAVSTKHKKDINKVVMAMNKLMNRIYKNNMNKKDKRIDICEFDIFNSLNITECRIELYIEQCIKIVSKIAKIIPVQSPLVIPFYDAENPIDIIGKITNETDFVQINDNACVIPKRK